MSSHKNIEVSIVTPMHNEELCIREFHSRVSATLRKEGWSHEIVLVNDGSTDRTGSIIRELSAEDPNLVGVFLSRNRGQCNAIYAGIQHSRGRYVVIMDGDLQHRPEEIPALVNKMREGYDMVSGMRQKRSESKWLRLVPSRIANWMIRKASGCEIHDMGGFSCIDGDMARSMHLREGHHRFLPAIIYRMGGAVAEVPTSAPPRFAGRSHYGISRSIDVLFDIVSLWFQNSFKQRPVYLFGRISLALFLFASALMVWVLFEKVFLGVHMGTRPPFMGAILLYLASLGFMSTGFILEAIGDTLDSVLQAKPYAVREVVRGGEKQETNG
ncbi:glycosyltransferase family 2 protein [Pseudodesulfovibrio tunisiensis]|uniref:glycosyltransferase family 2 protein n=1 Tax=Pseudodesulfovibrio tunisiensis TaxID=463192 RepID=UPI001FB21C11|nr:glycosyltransferase family 2 protein [Pseudodesulfovibrio tunisiensis]